MLVGSAQGTDMKANKLPKVLRDALGYLPGDPRRGARLKETLHPIMAQLWATGHTLDFTDQEIETAISELVDEEVVRRLAEEFIDWNAGSHLPGKATPQNPKNACGRSKDPNRP